MLTDDDKRWLTDEFDRAGTRLVTRFQRSMSPVEMRARSHSAAIRAMDEEIESLQDRVKKLEGNGPG